MNRFSNILDGERSIILELNREHEYACRVHKINLRPIGIALFDSENAWGQFDSVTGMIFISRKLVSEHSWDKVVGVLRHEMAHQYAHEQAPKRFEFEKPHSELFKDACRRLGVPPQFARAGLDLSTNVPDGRAKPRDEATEKILSRVQKLLNLEVAAGCCGSYMLLQGLKMPPSCKASHK